ncbi:type III secretion system cytoplasmic ring protein SctQ [Massilia sp. GER05]|uniref:type III secretion system cytoplasmic ring protein SctQ n=1 Tax=Massilia sp. GER05 TaxID=3394605 RepID=UPI003F8660F2
MQTTTATTPLADRLRRYTPALASLARALYDARGALHGTVRAVPEGPPRTGKTAQLTVACDQGELHVHVDADAAFEAIALEPEAACRAAVASLYLAGPLAALARHGATRPAVRDVRLAAPSASRAGVLHLEYDHDGAATGAATGATTGATVAGVSAALAAALAERIGPRGRGVLTPALAALALPTRLRLRTRHTTPALLRTLRPGDVLLGWPAAPGFAPHAALGQATLLWGAANGHAVHAHARIDSRNVILESSPYAMNHDPDLSLRAAPDAASSPLDVSDVELPVHIEVVTVNLPIGQIAALQPGYILALPVALADADIRLVAHGQTLAFGELVAIGDQLGLHIRRIANADERRA